MTSAIPSPDSVAISVCFRGVRGSIPTPGFETARYGGNTSCIELRAGDDILILDAGSGIRKLGEDLSEEFGSRPITAHIILSHTHWDHIQGLPFFVPLYAPQNRIRLLSGNGDAATLERALRNQMQPLHFPVALEQMAGLAGLGSVSSHHTYLGQFLLDKKMLNHPGGCAGLRVAVRDASIAYLPDHEPYRRYSPKGENSVQSEARRQALLRFLGGVDLLILDTQYTEAEYLKHIGWGHGCLSDSVALAVEAGVRKLLLFHHDPSHGDDEIDRMVEEARRLAGSASLVIEAAAEGQRLGLGSKAEPKENLRRSRREDARARVEFAGAP